MDTEWYRLWKPQTNEILSVTQEDPKDYEEAINKVLKKEISEYLEPHLRYETSEAAILSNSDMATINERAEPKSEHVHDTRVKKLRKTRMPIFNVPMHVMGTNFVKDLKHVNIRVNQVLSLWFVGKFYIQTWQAK